MDVINEIIRHSAIGTLPNWFKSIVLILFSSILATLLSMLLYLLARGPHLNITFGY